jgi:hypothetical protein
MKIKKIILTAGLIFALFPLNSKAQLPMSFGAGGLIDYNFNNGMKDDYKNYIKFRDLNYGYYACLDATFIELSFRYSNGSLTNYAKLSDVKTTKGIGSITKMGYSLLFKFPIVDDGGLSLALEDSKYVIYPLMFGIDQMWGISRENGNDSYFGDISASGVSQFSFLFGTEADYNISGALFIRGKALFRMGVYKAAKEYAERYNGLTSVGFGFCGELGIGYRFLRHNK